MRTKRFSVPGPPEEETEDVEDVAVVESAVKVRAVLAKACPRVRRRVVVTRAADGRDILQWGMCGGGGGGDTSLGRRRGERY